MRLLLLALLCATLLPLSAQYKGGTTGYLDVGSVSVNSFGPDDLSPTRLTVGQFVADNLLLSLRTDLVVDYSDFEFERTNLAPSLRYYAPVGWGLRPYAESGVDVGLGPGDLSLGYFGAVGAEAPLGRGVFAYADFRFGRTPERFRRTGLSVGLSTRLGADYRAGMGETFGLGGDVIVNGNLALNVFSDEEQQITTTGLAAEVGYFIGNYFMLEAGAAVNNFNEEFSDFDLENTTSTTDFATSLSAFLSPPARWRMLLGAGYAIFSGGGRSVNPVTRQSELNGVFVKAGFLYRLTAGVAWDFHLRNDRILGRNVASRPLSLRTGLRVYLARK